MSEFYIQRHESGFLGNAPIWWRKGGAGYSAYLEEAERFSQEEAEKICRAPVMQKGEKYVAYPCEFIDARTHTVFDHQSFRDLKQWCGEHQKEQNDE